MDPLDYSSQTTLITGASSGIGLEFARQLAAKGSDVVLVARRKARLDALAAELTAAHGIRAHVIPLDLTLPAAGGTLRAATDQVGVQVTSAINCAGFGTYGQFRDEDAARLRDEIAVDIAALVDITRAFIEPLKSAGNGMLVNVASVAAYVPIPGMAVYAASKAFVLSFTEALWYELKGTGVRVLSFAPGATDTEFFEVTGTDAADGGTKRQTAAEVVAFALATLERRTPPPSIISGRSNRLLGSLGRLVPRKTVVNAAGRMNA